MCRLIHFESRIGARLIHLGKYLELSSNRAGWQSDAPTSVNIARLSELAGVNPAKRVSPHEVITLKPHDPITSYVAQGTA
jgi:hypothetical protein